MLSSWAYVFLISVRIHIKHSNILNIQRVKKGTNDYLAHKTIRHLIKKYIKINVNQQFDVI